MGKVQSTESPLTINAIVQFNSTTVIQCTQMHMKYRFCLYDIPLGILNTGCCDIDHIYCLDFSYAQDGTTWAL